jgi:nucleoside-diphosphate-sugar epimerase
LNILITGGGGFLGSALAKRFSETKNQISLLVRKSTKLQRIPDLSKFKLGICETDQDINQFIYTFRPDVVIHTACSYGRNGENMAQMIDSNIRFGVSVLEALMALDKNTTFINTSTVLSEDANLYAQTKILFDKLGFYISDISNKKIQFINVKLHMMYGPGDDLTKFPTYVIESCRRNSPELPLTNGEQLRDFIYVDDVAVAYEKILENIHRMKQKEEIEVGTGVGIRIKDFVEVVHKMCNSKTELQFGKIPYYKNDEMYLVANITSLKLLGWKPIFNIDQGIKKILH